VTRNGPAETGVALSALPWSEIPRKQRPNVYWPEPNILMKSAKSCALLDVKPKEWLDWVQGCHIDHNVDVA